MSDSCNNNCSFTSKEHLTPRYKTILWIVLIINAGMFLVEMIAGVKGQSVSLMADAVDFLSDAGNYVITLVVLGMSLRHRAIAALVKGVSMGAVGLWVLGSLAYYALQGTVPSVPIMSTVAFLALTANVISAFLLYRYREGDSNMRSVWICSRNDAISNIAVMLAAGAVYFVGHGWPDLLVALIMAAVSLYGAWQIINAALKEIKYTKTHPHN
jgi:cation diffusion facilitator family transporter